MIYVKQNNINKWRVRDYTFNDPQMGIRTINLTVNHPVDWVDGEPVEKADFTDAYVEYDGERYDIVNLKPTAEKDISGLSYKYTLAFEGAEAELKKRKVRNLAETGVDNFVSQGTNFSIYANINQFAQLLNNNLKYYFGDKWTINLGVPSSDEVNITISNMYLWDLLLKTYEYYGLRFFIRGNTINIGQDPDYIDHIFDYGAEGGLVKIARITQEEPLINRLIGMGGSRNVPINYFTNRYSKFPSDPNPISGDVNIKNIMPKSFRDSVKTGTLPYKDYVEDASLVALNGVHEDSLEPNEDIYPSIAGVEVPGLGRIDQIIAVESVSAGDPDDADYSPTFDIWVKDIGFNLKDDIYTSTEEAKISFTSGLLTGYEFTILAQGGKRVVEVDTSKSHNGVSSKYRIRLIKSDEELDASGMMLPYNSINAVAGDSFVIYDIEMPQSYVELAEQRVEDWLNLMLDEVKVEKPTFSIEPMDMFFEDDAPESDGKTIKQKLKSGNKLSINNTKTTDGIQELFINSVNIQYGGLLPKYTFAVTDKVQVQGSAVSRLQSAIDTIMVRQNLTQLEINSILKDASRKYLSKLNPDTAKEVITFLKGIIIGEFTPGMFGGKGARIDALGNAEMTSLRLRAMLEVPELRYNRLTVIGDEFILTENGLIEMVEHLENRSYRLNMKLEEEERIAFLAGDLVKGIYHHANGFSTSYMRIEEVGETFMKITLAAENDTPTGFNFPPQPIMNIARVGNVSDPDRQRYMVFSSKLGGFQLYDGCSDFLNGTLVGSYDTAQSFKHKFENLPLKEGLPYLYAAGIVVQDIIRVDYQGKSVREIYDRGAWQEGTTYYNNDEQGTDDVWHLGCRWRCFSSSTTEEPSWTSAAWYMIEGRSDARMEFDTNLFGALPAGFSDFIITPVVFIGNTNVSGDIVDEQWRWTRDSGHEAADVVWNAQHSNNGRVLNLSNTSAKNDMGNYWSKAEPVTFTCVATYPASSINEIKNWVQV